MRKADCMKNESTMKTSTRSCYLW